MHGIFVFLLLITVTAVVSCGFVVFALNSIEQAFDAANIPQVRDVQTKASMYPSQASYASDQTGSQLP